MRILLAAVAFPAPVVVPSSLRIGDRHALPCLSAATKQDHQLGTIEAKIDPVAWPEVDPYFAMRLTINIIGN